MLIEELQRALLDVAGVTSVTIIPHEPMAIAVFVEGGDAHEIASVLWAHKPMGIETIGDVRIETLSHGAMWSEVRFTRGKPWVADAGNGAGKTCAAAEWKPQPGEHVWILAKGAMRAAQGRVRAVQASAFVGGEDLAAVRCEIDGQDVSMWMPVSALQPVRPELSAGYEQQPDPKRYAWVPEMETRTPTAEGTPTYDRAQRLATPELPDCTVMRSKPWGESLYVADKRAPAGQLFDGRWLDEPYPELTTRTVTYADERKPLLRPYQWEALREHVMSGIRENGMPLMPLSVDPPALGSSWATKSDAEILADLRTMIDEVASDPRSRGLMPKALGERIHARVAEGLRGHATTVRHWKNYSLFNYSLDELRDAAQLPPLNLPPIKPPRPEMPPWLVDGVREVLEPNVLVDPVAAVAAVGHALQQWEAAFNGRIPITTKTLRDVELIARGALRELEAAGCGKQVPGAVTPGSGPGGDPGVRPADPPPDQAATPAAAPADPEADLARIRCELAREELEAGGVDLTAFTTSDLVAHYDRVIRPREHGAKRTRYVAERIEIRIGGELIDPSGHVDGSLLKSFGGKAGR